MLPLRQVCTWPNTTLVGGDAPGSVMPNAGWQQLKKAGSWVRLREMPGNLSGSGSETHQHFSPAVANCCYSLLLDPDATIGIDLRKRLFLLVSGRGE
jgi:hypothetical protein